MSASVEESTRRVTFGHLLRAEWIKLVTVRSTWWLVGLIVVLMGFLGATSSDGEIVPTQSDLGGRLVFGLFLGQILVGLLGGLAATSEWSTGLIRATLSFAPRRRTWLLAKASVVGLVAMAVLVVSVLVAYAGMALTGRALPDPTDPDVLRILAATTVYLGAVAMMSVAFGALVRHTGVVVGLVVMLFFLVPNLIPGFDSQILNAVGPYLPTGVGDSLIGTRSAGPVSDPLPVAAAALVLIAWVIVPLAVATRELSRRDV